MKGIMALPLLTIYLTGMVNGQQFQNNSNQFGNDFRETSPLRTAQSRSVMDGNSGNAPQNSSSPGSINSLGPLEMVLDDQLIESFKRQGQLTALIKPRQYVNEILFLYEGNHTHHENHGHDGSTAIDVTGAMTPVSKQGNVLAFELDDFDLETLKKRGLKYTFDQFERGRYESVRVDYRPAAGQQNSNRFDSAGTNNNWPPNNNNQPAVCDIGTQFDRHSISSLPPPSPDYSRPGDANFMGPSLRPIRPNPGRDSISQETNRRTQNQDFGQTTWDPNPSPGNQTNPWNDRSNGIPSNATDNTSMAAQRKQQELEIRRNALLEQKLLLEEQELAEMERANRLKEQSIRDRQLQVERERLRAEFAQQNPGSELNATGNGTPNRLISNTSKSYGDTLVDGFGSPPSRNNSNLTPQPTNDGGVRNLQTAIQGPQDLKNQQNPVNNNNGQFQRNNLLGDANEKKTEGIVYFMLLFSLGLNVYLSWISRGFYVRYNELADELRETFTATM